MAAKIQNLYISRVIFRYAGMLGKVSDQDATLEIIANMAKDLVRADRCSIWLIDQDRGEIFTRIAQDSREIRLKSTEGLVGKCMQTGCHILSNSPSADTAFSATADHTTGYVTTSVLVVPMRSPDGTVMGAFQALNKSGGFSERDRELLGLAASFSVAVIANQNLQKQADAARQLKRDLEIARDVQRRMLPSVELLDTQGLDIWTHCSPASEVGGDFYDFLRASDLLAITIGDVSGKGIGAALMMASQQSTIRGLIPGMVHSPALLCSELNRITYATSSPERYATLFLASYNAYSATLHYCNAGHVYPYVIRPNGEATCLVYGGPPIGLLPEAEFRNGRIGFGIGDILVCYSDGLSECQNNAGKMWQDVSLSETLADIRGLSARSSVNRLVSAAGEFSAGCPQFDDITVICVRPVGD